MKNYKKGFTLAEVLITLGILGVIASLTLPTLSENTFKHQVGPALAKAISSLESANKIALQDNNARTLDEIDKKAYFGTTLAPYMSLQKATKKTYKKYDGKANLPLGNAITQFNSSDGMTYIHNETSAPVKANYCPKSSRLYSGKYYSIYVDVNGSNKGPNALGKDLFKLYVDTKGSVIPHGSTIDSKYSLNYIGWEKECKDHNAEGFSAFSCAGSIVDNGFRVIYY